MCLCTRVYSNMAGIRARWRSEAGDENTHILLVLIAAVRKYNESPSRPKKDEDVDENCATTQYKPLLLLGIEN